MNRTSIFTILAVFGLLLVASPAIALGTAPNTPINNLATVTYYVGGALQSAIGSSPGGNTSGPGSNTTFLVDQKIDIDVTTTDSAAVSIAPGGTALTTFTVTNEGNTVQDIRLSAVALANGTDNPFAPASATKDSFDSSAAVVFYEESGATAGFQAAEDLAVTWLDEVSSTAGSNSRTVYMEITAPAAQAQGTLSVYALRGTVAVGGSAGAQGVAESEAGNTGALNFVDTVFADAAGTDDVIYNGQHSDRSAYLVNTAAVTISKNAAVYDSGNTMPTDTYAIPGAVVTYTINVTNTGAADADNVVIQDTIPPNTVFFTTDNTLATDPTITSGSISFSNDGGATWTYNPSFTAYSVDGNAIGYTDAGVDAIQYNIATLGNTTGDETATFKVKID